MLMNLFSNFDPMSILNIEMNWLSSMIGLTFMPMKFWMNTSRYSKNFNLINKMLKNEFMVILSKNSFGVSLMFISLFFMILMNNLMGLVPYIFTSTSHLTFTLTFSLSMWISYMIFGWVNQTNQMFSHLVPNGTPIFLTPFMVIIETISNLIRSGTLSVRLTANMISGHLLLTLMGNQGSSLPMALLVIFIFIQLALVILEISVAMIQSYVFSILACLYSSEVTPHE